MKAGKQPEFISNITKGSKFISDLLEKYKPQIKFVCYQFPLIVFSYGLITNFAFHILFKYSFNLSHVVAFGIAVYLLKFELPSILNSSFPKAPKIEI